MAISLAVPKVFCAYFALRLLIIGRKIKMYLETYDELCISADKEP